MADAIFISYRRDDSEGEAGRLFDDLTRAFGSQAVFMDVAGIKPGVDFRSAIEQNVAGCGVLLAIIGPSWLTVANPDGTRRLNDPDDFVALEIASAMKRQVPVIPVLVHDARMPPAAQLPKDITNLAFHNSVELSHARWNSDAALLIDALKAYVNPVANADDQPVHATVPVQLPAPHPPDGNPAHEKPTTGKLYLGVACALVVILCVVGWLVASKRKKPVSRKPNPFIVQTTGAPDATGGTADASSTATNAGSGIASPFTGTWKRVGQLANKANIVKLGISLRGNKLAIEATEAGGNPWPQQPGQMKGHALHATFFFPGHPDTYELKIVPDGPAQLTVTETATSPDGAHSKSDKFTCARDGLLGSQ